MTNQQIVMLAHDWLENVKVDNRLSYKDIGDIIDYTKAGVSKAMTKKTLKVKQILKIAKVLNLEEEFVKHTGYKVEEVNELQPNPGPAKIREISTFIVENEDLLMHDKVFRTWFENKLNKKVTQEILKQINLKR